MKKLRDIITDYQMKQKQEAANGAGMRHTSQFIAFADVLKRILDEKGLLDVAVNPTPKFEELLHKTVDSLRSSGFGGYDYDYSFKMLRDPKNQPAKMHLFLQEIGPGQISRVDLVGVQAPSSPGNLSSFSMFKPKQAYVLKDKVSDNFVDSVKRNAANDGVEIRGRNGQGEPRFITIYDDGQVSGFNINKAPYAQVAAKLGVVGNQMYHHREAILHHFDMHSGPSHKMG